MLSSAWHTAESRLQMATKKIKKSVKAKGGSKKLASKGKRK